MKTIILKKKKQNNDDLSFKNETDQRLLNNTIYLNFINIFFHSFEENICEKNATNRDVLAIDLYCGEMHGLNSMSTKS